VDEQPNWKMILPAAAMAGFILTAASFLRIIVKQDIVF